MHQYLFLVCAFSLAQIRLHPNPTESAKFKQNAADRMAYLCFKILSSQGESQAGLRESDRRAGVGVMSAEHLAGAKPPPHQGQGQGGGAMKEGGYWAGTPAGGTMVNGIPTPDVSGFGGSLPDVSVLLVCLFFQLFLTCAYSLTIFLSTPLAMRISGLGILIIRGLSWMARFGCRRISNSVRCSVTIYQEMETRCYRLWLALLKRLKYPSHRDTIPQSLECRPDLLDCKRKFRKFSCALLIFRIKSQSRSMYYSLYNNL